MRWTCKSGEQRISHITVWSWALVYGPLLWRVSDEWVDWEPPSVIMRAIVINLARFCWLCEPKHTSENGSARESMKAYTRALLGARTRDILWFEPHMHVWEYCWWISPIFYNGRELRAGVPWAHGVLAISGTELSEIFTADGDLSAQREVHSCRDEGWSMEWRDSQYCPVTLGQYATHRVPTQQRYLQSETKICYSAEQRIWGGRA